jgi:hypothetical protein
VARGAPADSGLYCVAVDVLGIEVGPALVRRWAGWLAPACQPFFLTAGEVVDLGFTPDRSGRDLSFELCDTYQVWNHPEGLDVVWLDEQEFHAQPRDVRAELVRAQARHRRGAVPTIGTWADLLDAQALREQADGQHFVWWPTLLALCTEAILKRVVTDDQLPCQRMSVPDDVWRAATSVLPHARALSGTFAYGRASCFGTVMAASGVPGAADVWMVREPFEAWLAATCAAGGRDDAPGTVLVWRDADLTSTHTAVTLGGGWALHKPGQDWICPRQVVTVHDLIRTAPPGVTLHRYSLQDTSSGTAAPAQPG